jgi:hypothetical protein
MTDQDIDRWTAAWREGTPPVADLARLARRERRWLLTWIAFDWLVAAGLVAFAAWIWVNDTAPGMRFVAVAVVVLTLVALAFTVRNWRGSLAGDRSSATDFLALAMHRSRARQRYIRFGWLLLAANVVVITIAFTMDYADLGRERLPELIGLIGLVIAVSAGILSVWGRRERRRAARLAAMRDAMERTGDEQ